MVLPDFVFSTFPGGLHHKPLIFVTVMTFILILSSVTMVRAVQEGKQENRMGVVKWMGFTIIELLCSWDVKHGSGQI
jgi:cytochrome c oxidase subunit 3